MSYFSYFYSKNVFNICIFIFLGFVIAIVDVKGREIIKKIVGAGPGPEQEQEQAQAQEDIVKD